MKGWILLVLHFTPRFSSKLFTKCYYTASITSGVLQKSLCIPYANESLIKESTTKGNQREVLLLENHYGGYLILKCRTLSSYLQCRKQRSVTSTWALLARVAAYSQMHWNNVMKVKHSMFIKLHRTDYAFIWVVTICRSRIKVTDEIRNTESRPNLPLLFQPEILFMMKWYWKHCSHEKTGVVHGGCSDSSVGSDGSDDSDGSVGSVCSDGSDDSDGCVGSVGSVCSAGSAGIVLSVLAVQEAISHIWQVRICMYKTAKNIPNGIFIAIIFLSSWY